MHDSGQGCELDIWICCHMTLCLSVRREIETLNDRLAAEGQTEGADLAKGALKSKGGIFFTYLEKTYKPDKLAGKFFSLAWIQGPEFNESCTTRGVKTAAGGWNFSVFLSV